MSRKHIILVQRTSWREYLSYWVKETRKKRNNTHSRGQDSRFEVWLIKLIRLKFAHVKFDNCLIKNKHYSCDSNIWKVLLLNTWYHVSTIEINTFCNHLLDITNISSRRNFSFCFQVTMEEWLITTLEECFSHFLLLYFLLLTLVSGRS